eukprot:10987284-Alexandrium_andersonii.AAC.1
MSVLKGNKTQPSVVKVTPTFKWPILGDDGPDAKEVEEGVLREVRGPVPSGQRWPRHEPH